MADCQIPAIKRGPFVFCSKRDKAKKLLLSFPAPPTDFLRPTELSGAAFYLKKDVLTFSGLIHLRAG
jgi:hypothetical protein